jgi:4'-phosphopantetheinyl transferase EntD
MSLAPAASRPSPVERLEVLARQDTLLGCLVLVQDWGRPSGSLAFEAGREALRLALRACLWNGDGELARLPWGAPEVPPGFAGSISHKAEGGSVLAVGLAAPGADQRLGVDLEVVDAPRESLARMVLTDQEADCLEGLPAGLRWRGTLLRFSLTEALYKALDPAVQPLVDFKDVSMFPHDDGSVCSRWHAPRAEPVATMQARWQALDRLLLTCARAPLVAGPARP